MVRIVKQIIPNMKKNKKKFMLHHVGNEGSFQMDIMFDHHQDTQFAWLMLINIATRKLYEEQINVRGKQFKTTDAILKTLVTIVSKIKQDGKKIKVIRCDSEKAFQAPVVISYLADEGITIMPVQKFDGHSHHTALAIIDRAIRTIRDNAAKNTVDNIYHSETGNVQTAVETFQSRDVGLVPFTVKTLVDKYNDTAHSYLTKMLGKPTTPNEVTEGEEDTMRDKLHEMNDKVQNRRGYDLNPGKTVDIERKFDPHDKHDRISAYEEGLVQDRVGSYYRVHYGSKVHVVPRWQLTNPK